jgi:dipeptidyl aminopeptidase/acylaminoacyl peptidase
LIHGTADHNIPASHSITLAEANPARTKLWLVPGARHTGAAAVEPGEFERRVLAWFAEHP